MRFEDIKPGQEFATACGAFVKIDPGCVFAGRLPRPHFFAVQVKTGVLTFLGPDTEVTPKGTTLWQLHWRYPDGKTEMRAQFEDDFADNGEFMKYILDVQERHRLPNDCRWQFFREDHPKFELAVAGGVGEL